MPEGAAATGVPEQPQSGQPRSGQPVAQDAGRPGLLTVLLWVGLLVAAGLGLGVAGYFKVYPRPEAPIAIPASPSLLIYTSVHVGQISYAVAEDRTGLPEVRITVSAGRELIGDELQPVPVPKPATTSIELTLPTGLAFRDCGGACHNYAGESAWVQPLNLQAGTATDVFPVNPVTTTGFGVDVSSTYAYAAIPEVSFTGLPPPQAQEVAPPVLPPFMSVQYPVPGAGHYDWSSGPVPSVSGPDATWQEILGTSDTPAQTAAGVDHSRQKHDADRTFFAGLLIGLAGSVVLAGLQLLLPSLAGSGARRK